MRVCNHFSIDMPFQVDVAAPVATLAAGEKQKVEILKELYLGNRILILDEPTSVLTPDEADQVLGRLREMTRAGTLSVLLITHKLREVKAFAEVVSVLRRGRLVGEANIDDIDTGKACRAHGGTKRISQAGSKGRCLRGEHPASDRRIVCRG